VGNRSRSGNILQLNSNRLSFARANPYRQLALTIDVTQHDYPVLRYKTDSDAVDHDLDHTVPLILSPTIGRQDLFSDQEPLANEKASWRIVA
jgi:hypothetical protein